MKRTGFFLLVLLGLLGVGYFLFGPKYFFSSKPPEEAKSEAQTQERPQKALPYRSVPQGPPEMGADFEDDPVGTLRLEGQVVDKDGNGVPGVIVHLNSNPPRFTQSKEHGWFAFDNLVGRFYYLEARHEDSFGSVWVRLEEESDPVTLRLEPGASLTVTVLDARDRSPIEGAEVKEGWFATSTARTDPEGKAILRGLSPGGALVEVRAEGYGIAQDFVNLPSQPGATGEKTFLLEPGAFVSGVVLDPEGQPVQGAKVEVNAASDWFFYGNNEEEKILTDAEGRWQTPALKAGTYRFRARHGKFAPGLSEPVTTDGQTPHEGVTIQLEEGGLIAGKVVNSAGEPVPSALVRVSEAQMQGMRSDRRAYSDENGEFTIEGLPKRELLLAASEESASSEVARVDLGASPEVRGLTLTLDQDGTISGVVLDAKGEPVADAQVSARPEDIMEKRLEWSVRGFPNARTDPDGVFVIKGLPRDGSFSMVAIAPGTSRRTSDLEKPPKARPGDTDVRLIIQDSGSIRGRVLFADGSAPAKFTVSAGWRSSNNFTDPGGVFVLENVATGSVRLRVSGKGFVTHEKTTVEVRAGEEVDVGTIIVEGGRTIRGRVLTQRGAPVSGATVVASRFINASGSRLQVNPDQDSNAAVTTEDGSFTITGLKRDEDLSVLAEHPSHGRSEIKSVPKGEGEATVELRLLPGGSLEGIVTYQGAPVQARLSAKAEGIGSLGGFHVSSGPDGLYRFDNLTPGVYLVTAQRSPANGDWQTRLGAKTGQVVIEAGKTAKLDIEIPGGVSLSIKVTQNGVPLSDAGVFLVKGSFSVADTKELMEQAGSLAGDASYWTVIRKTPIGGRDAARFEDVIPGDYTLCAWKTASFEERNSFDPNASFPVSCEPITIPASPASQEITRDIP